MDGGSLYRDIDEVLTRNAAVFLETVPFASHLNDDAPLDAAYYVRHRIETIKRIRGTAKTDALALAVMTEENYDAARLWGRYTAEEMTHDVLFAEDLRAHGVSMREIDETEPFDATRRLLDYLTRRIGELGSLPAVAYSLLVEWNSERYSSVAIEKARRTFGEEHVTRSAEHYAIDETEDHYSMMVTVARGVMDARGHAPEVLFALLDDIAALLRDSFAELYAATAGATLAEAG